MLPEEPGVAPETGSVLTLVGASQSWRHVSRRGISVVEASQSWRQFTHKHFTVGSLQE